MWRWRSRNSCQAGRYARAIRFTHTAPRRELTAGPRIGSRLTFASDRSAPVGYGGYGVMAALGVVDPSAAGRNRLVAPQIASTDSPIDMGPCIGVDATQSTIKTSRGDPGSQASRASQDTVCDHHQGSTGCVPNAGDPALHGRIPPTPDRARDRVLAWSPSAMAKAGRAVRCRRVLTRGRPPRTLRTALRPLVEGPSSRRDDRLRSARPSSTGIRPDRRGHRDERGVCHSVANWIA